MTNKSLKLINIGNLVSYNSKKEAVYSEKNLEIVALTLLILITIIFTSYYNYNKM